MNRTEIVNLLAMAVEGQPSFQLNDRTPEVWFEALKLVTYADARTGLVEALRRERYLSVAAVYEHAQRARGARLEKAFASGGTPDADPDDPRAYIAALRAGKVAVPTPATAPGLPRPEHVEQVWPPPERETLHDMAARLGAQARERTAAQQAAAVREALAAARRERAQRGQEVPA